MRETKRHIQSHRKVAMGRLALTAFLGLGLLLPAQSADARRRRRHRPARQQAQPQASAAIKKLAGPFKWGMSHRQVERILIKKIRKQYVPKIRAARDNRLKQDSLRAEMQREIRKIRKSYIVFHGQKTNWDGSVVDDQFVHKNNESMLVMLERDQQRFFFFWNDQLYKQMIAFNADHPKYKGLTFPKFVAVLIQAYGQGKPVFLPDAAGINKLHHVEWRGSGNYILWALNKTDVYGNLCLMLLDASVLPKIEEARKVVQSMNPKTPAVDPLVQSITRKPAPEDQDEADSNQNDNGQ